MIILKFEYSFRKKKKKEFYDFFLSNIILAIFRSINLLTRLILLRIILSRSIVYSHLVDQYMCFTRSGSFNSWHLTTIADSWPVVDELRMYVARTKIYRTGHEMTDVVEGLLMKRYKLGGAQGSYVILIATSVIIADTFWTGSQYYQY